MSETPDTAPLWKAIQAVIEEAEGRYGLRLYGRVDQLEGDMFLLRLAGNHGDFSIAIATEFILRAWNGVSEYALYVAEQYLREIAKKRDRREAERVEALAPVDLVQQKL